LKNVFLFIAISTFTFNLSIAQNKAEVKLGVWNLYYGTNRISDKLSIYTELQYNLYEFESNYQQFWGIVGLNYHLAENAMATLGYGYFDSDVTFENIDNEKHPTENRIFEQFTYHVFLGKFKIQNRYRLEHRFLQTPVENITKHRARGRLQVNYPISEKWFLSMLDEVFVNLQEPIFDQNRWYTSVGYKFTNNIKFEFGYLKLHFTGYNLDRLQFILNINTDWRKKENEK